VKIGDGYYNLKRYGLAVKAYLQVAKDYTKAKEAPEADFGILLCLLQEKKYDSFIARVDAFVKRYPQHPLASQALIQLGDTYQQSRMREKAVKTYRELIQLYPNTEGAEEAQFRIALLLKQEKKWTEAIDEMEKFVKNHPKSRLIVEAQMEVGDLYVVLKDYSKALERYEWVIQNHPQDLMVKKAYLGTEEGYRNLGRSEQAVKIMKEFVGKYPNDDTQYEGYLRLGLLFLAQKKFGDAISALSNAVQSPEEGVASQAQLKLGEAYLGAEDKELALLQFSRVVYLYPHRPEVMEEALLKLGSLYMEGKKLTEAKQVYQKLLEKSKREDRREVAKRMLNQIQEEGLP
jgi:TolA-binding protein